MTNLFPQPVYVMVTALDRSQPGSYRVFISTLLPEELVLEKQEEAYFCPDVPQEDRKRLLPYAFYSYRWSIETIFYEQKTFWSFGNYKVRKKSGIHLYVDMLAVAYSCVQLLPFHQSQYAHLKIESAQVKKQWLGMRICEEVFFYTFVQSIEKRINCLTILKAFTRWVRRK
ncbi:hypothetical protein AKA01nite_10150 [Alkalibacterium kapii]|uniref:Transposase IS4-like domain-containing protein n=2 Tax=Alkalibacterium kapii TaxID=426704 RepID=A0A511AVM7_9LACT|nr:hypothetical protein AKA01nite_10150 [Alkalibacterium kapii]